MNNFDNFDPFQVFEVSHYPCSILYVKVVKGYNITKGWAADLMDTPDPFVSLFIRTSPNGMQKTKTIDNDVNPIWNETFKFYIDDRTCNTLEITLVDANYTIDETIGTTTLSLHNLPYAGKETKTLQFNKTSEVDIELWAEKSFNPDLRFSLTLCEEERAFLEKRKKFVFESMKKVLGSDAPKSSREVPVIGVLGSGGGFRAMTAYSGVFSALVDSGILDMVTYACGLSGSAWYLSQLYSNPEWPNKTPTELQPQLRDNIDSSPFLLLGPSCMYKYLSNIIEKRRQGQPVSFTDFFGHLVGETLLHDRMDQKLTEQKSVIEKGNVPMPLYTCLHVKRQVSAMIFHEWMEFSPFEIGLPKYGTFMRTEHFGSKFFMGQLVREHPEPPLHFLQGIWGSAFCIQLKRLFKDDKKVINECRSSIEEREEMEKELLDDMGTQKDEEYSDSSEFEDDTDDKKQSNKRQNKPDKPERKEEAKDQSFWKGVLGPLLDASSWINSIEGRAAKVHSFMRGLSLYKVYPFSPFTSINEESADQFDGIFELYPTTMKKLYVVDGGLTFNSPYPLLLRPQRQVDIILSFDFSARPSDDTPPFKEIKLAEFWAHKNNVPFPIIDTNIMEREGVKECYVFENPRDPKCPTVLHFVLSNINFRHEVSPDVPRQTDEEKEFADFKLFDDPNRPYSTFNFKYSHLAFNRITKLMEYNTLRFKLLIIQKIRECVRKHQNSVIRRPIKLKDIKKLKIGKKDKEDKLKQFVESFDCGDSD